MSQQPTGTEKVAGSLITEAALTAGPAAALALASAGAMDLPTVGLLLTPFLFVLSNSLAAGRQQARVTAELLKINQELTKHENLIKNLSDEQYKFVNEVTIAITQTTSVKKLEYLRNAILNGVKQALHSQEAVLLSRIVRDMSVDEAEFIVENYGADRISVSSKTIDIFPKKAQRIDPDSPEALIVTGLITLGVLRDAEITYQEGGMYEFTSITAKLISLITK